MNIKLHRTLQLVLFFVAVGLFANAQTSETQYFVPQSFPRSPTATALEKYGTYQVNEFTGIPDISIPLYTVESGGMQVPITLSYHASGNKVTDVASWVGLGWSVSSGGQVTRRVMGLPDDSPDGYLSGLMRHYGTINSASTTDVQYLESAANGTYDTKPDIYSYDFPGHSGKFFFDGSTANNTNPNGTAGNNTFPVRLVPYAPVKIQYTKGPLNITNMGAHFTITDEHGNRYLYGDAVTDTTWSKNGANVAQVGQSAWKIENMISQNRRDTISFSYSKDTINYPETMGEIYTVVDDINELVSDAGGAFQQSYANPPYTVPSGTMTTENLPAQINFKNGKVVFDLDTALRQDINGGGPNFLAYGLHDIKVYSYNYGTRLMELQKTIVFYKSYFNPTTYFSSERLRLDSIQVLDKAGSILQHYRFDYNTNIALPPYSSKQQDYWGYYNHVNNSELTPQMTIPFQFNGGFYGPNVTIGSDTINGRLCNPNYMQAFMLTGIHYPTGGYSTFTYETNQYTGTDGLHLAGGLRVKTISSYDGVSPTPIIKTYVYNTARVNFDVTNQGNIDNQFFGSVQTHKYWEDPYGYFGPAQLGATAQVRTFTTMPHCDLDGWDGATVVYPSVTEYIGTPGTNIGRTDYIFTDVPDTLLEASRTGSLIYASTYYRRGHLQSKKEYIHLPGGTYQIVKSTYNGYTQFPPSLYPNVGLAVGKTVYNEGPRGFNPFIGNSQGYDDTAPGTFLFQWYNISSDDNYLVGTTTKIYDTNDTTKYTTSSITYVYDDTTHQQIIKTIHTDSKGNTHISNNKYAYDYLNGGATTNNVVLDSMIERHMYAEPVEKWDSLQNVTTSVNAVTGAQLNQYELGINNTIVPYKISTLSVAQPLTNFAHSNVVGGSLTGDSRYVQMISFDRYDLQNNIAQYTPRNGTPTSILWDHNYELPVAQVKNAVASAIAYTSFEADGKGNWVYNGTPVTDPTAPTGTMVYPLAAGSVNYNTLSANISYVLSYWSNNGAATVSAFVYPTSTYLTSTPLNSSNGWTYYEAQVPAGYTYLTLSGTTSIDELRLYPVAAQMTTYAYDPSGLRSISDTKGTNSYFEYDFAQRLKNIKDWNGNIVKNYGYHMYDMTYGNQLQTATFTRQGCPAGTAPTSLTYTVPANRYYSSTLISANADAAYDMNVNGQSKANANCGCPIAMISYALTNNSGITGWTAVFSGISTPYNFPASGTVYVQVPEGTYASVYVGAVDTHTHTFTMGGFTPVINHNATFNTVLVQPGSANLTLTVQ